jgi:hypothetical protein
MTQRIVGLSPLPILKTRATPAQRQKNPSGPQKFTAGGCVAGGRREFLRVGGRGAGAGCQESGWHPTPTRRLSALLFSGDPSTRPSNGLARDNGKFGPPGRRRRTWSFPFAPRNASVLRGKRKRPWPRTSCPRWRARLARRRARVSRLRPPVGGRRSRR